MNQPPPAFTLNIGSKIVNLIPDSTIQFSTTGAAGTVTFATLLGGGLQELTSQQILNSITIAGAAEATLNGTFNVPASATVNADGELSIGKKVVNGAAVVDWDITEP